LKKGSKLGSVIIDVKGNKGDLVNGKWIGGKVGSILLRHARGFE
jgi:hypothetical protein